MKIHCFYNDLILSLRCFFDRIIFPGGLIKNYQFNFGNRSVQLNYDTTFELPSIIINYRTSRPMFYHPYTFQKSPIGNNCNTIPVLYDYDKRLTLLLHEEHFEFNIEVLINCESQLSAIQIEHVLQNTLILNKFLQFYKFYSFLEVDRQFINSDMFDINHDHILNLFQKYNQLTDTTDHCFAVQYEPLIKMDSVDIQLGSTDQRSFQVALSLTMMNPVPIYLEIPPLERGTKYSKTTRILKDSIISTSNIPMIGIKILIEKDIDPIIGVLSLLDLVQPPEVDIDPNFIPSNADINVNFSILSNKGDVYTGRILGEITGVNYICKVRVIIGTIDLVCVGTIYRDFSTAITKLQLFGPIDGIISNAKLSLDSGTSIISGIFYGFIKSSRVPVNQRVKFEYTVDTIYYTSNVLKTIADFECYSTTSFLLSGGNLYNQLPDLNLRLLKPKCDQIRIKQVAMIYDGNDVDIYLGLDIYCDDVGNFKFSFKYTDSTNYETVVSVSGKLHPNTFKLYYDVSLTNLNPKIPDISINITALVFDFVFESTIGYGARYIETINIDFIDNTSGIASAYGSATKIILPDERDRSKRTLLRTYILTKYDIDVAIEYDTAFSISIPFDIEFDYDHLVLNNVVSWVFNISSDLKTYTSTSEYRFDNYCSEVTIAKRTPESLSNVIEFLFDKSIYMNIFAKTTVDNPIFFQIYVEGEN